MKITYLNSASVLIQDEKVKILCDPWLDGEEYFGSWGIYPPYDFHPDDFKDVDFIHISHIHPDHCSASTLSKLNKEIPIIIHKFPEKFLKSYLESFGFSVIEIEHGKRTKLKEDLFINIFAADNCNPEICGKLMGCDLIKKELGTNQIDTLSIIDNGKETIVNTNDCPYAIAEGTAIEVKKKYPKIDFLLVGYVKASSYPQCFDLEEREKIREAEIKQEKKLATTLQYVRLFKPRFYMPFAGRYTLTGRNISLNKYRGEPELETAYEYLSARIPEYESKCIVLNHDCFFDISKNFQSKEFEPVNFDEKDEYVKTKFLKKKYEYENETIPEVQKLRGLIPQCYHNFENTRKSIGWSSKTKIILEIDHDEFVVVSCDGSGFSIMNSEQIKSLNQFLFIKSDIRLLYSILQGPKKVHWSLADIGCHLSYKRVPNNYERGLYFCLNNFFANSYNE